MKNLLSILFIIPAMFISSVAFASPKAIIIIRHADKLVQSAPGPSLSPQGELRAIKFAYYFLKNFGEPDFIITKNPDNNQGKGTSIRELQTVAPLANLLAENHPNKGFPILHSYTKSDYQKLANDLLTNPKFSNKIVLICWDHGLIPSLAEKLGVIPRPHKWSSKKFDTVYLLQYNSQGKIANFRVLDNQYPVFFNGSWETIYKKSQER